MPARDEPDGYVYLHTTVWISMKGACTCGHGSGGGGGGNSVCCSVQAVAVD